MWRAQFPPSPWCCPGNLLEVTDHCSVTLLPPSLQVLSTLGDDDEEEGHQALVCDPAAVSGELGRLWAAWRGRQAGQASHSKLVTGCGGRWSFMVVAAQAC